MQASPFPCGVSPPAWCGRAADDAAGLPVRELMRADVAALGQGARNANDESP